MGARLATLINELSGYAATGAAPTFTTILRVAKAAHDEVNALARRLDAIDPATRAADEIRPLAVVEREACEAAIRQLESVPEAARALDVSPATLYRRLQSWREEDRCARGDGRAS